MPFATIVIGPAGVGKTTMAHALQVHGEVKKRGISVINLDPAADALPYSADVDIRDLITVEDAMAEMGFGPNGGLIYCMEYLLSHLEWLEEKVSSFGEDETLIVDCPGQLELYTHVPVMPRVVAALEGWGVRLCVAYLMDAVAVHDPSKFVAGSLAGLAAMLTIPAPRLTVLSKADLVPSSEALEDFLELQSVQSFLERSEENEREVFGRVRTPNYGYAKLQRAFCRVVDDHAMLSFVPFSVKDDDAPGHVLSFSDQLTQYAEHAEVRIHEDERPAVDYDRSDDAFGDAPRDDDAYLDGYLPSKERSLEEAAKALFGPGVLGDGYS